MASGHNSGDTWTGLIHPKAMLRFFGRNFASISLVAILVFILGMAAYILLPAKYSATALILVDPRQPRITMSEDVLAGIGGDAAALASYVEIMNSDGFLSKVVDELDIETDPDFAKAKNKVELIAAFRKNLSAYRRGATYIVEVSYLASSAEKAARFANGVAEAFVRDQKNLRLTASETASQWLSQRLNLLRSNLKTSEDAVAAYQARQGIVDTGGNQGTLDSQRLTSLVNQLATTTTEMEDARARYEQARKDGVPASSSTYQSGQFTNLDQLLQEEARLRRAAAQLNQTLGARHPNILANREQQRIIAGQIAAEKRRLVRRTEQAYQAAKTKKLSLERSLADARARAITQNKASVELANLQREATANRNLYEQFLARYKITDEQTQLQTSESRIASAATPPAKSTKPSIKLVAAVLFVLSCFIGIIVALVREAFAAPLPSEVRHQVQPIPASLHTKADIESEKDTEPSSLQTAPAAEILAKVRQESQSIPLRPQSAAKPNARKKSAIILTLPDPVDRDTRSKAFAKPRPVNSRSADMAPPHRTGDQPELEALLDDKFDQIDAFLGGKLQQGPLSVLVSSMQPYPGDDVTAELLREYAIVNGLRPMIVTISQAAPNRRSRSEQEEPRQQATTGWREFDHFDKISFVCPPMLDQQAALSVLLRDEVGRLINLCKDNYRLIIVEARLGSDADLLDDLIEICDRTMLVLDEQGLEQDDLADWQDWALGSGVGLVLGRAIG